MIEFLLWLFNPMAVLESFRQLKVRRYRQKMGLKPISEMTFQELQREINMDWKRMLDRL